MNKSLTCPICRNEIVDSAPAAEEFFPFCSLRCRQIDLLRWSDGRYAIVEPLTHDQVQEEMYRTQEPNGE